MKKIIRIEGMSCQHCVASIENAVGTLEGVEAVTVSLDNKNAAVSFDENQVETSKIYETIEEIGFDVVKE